MTGKFPTKAENSAVNYVSIFLHVFAVTLLVSFLIFFLIIYLHKKEHLETQSLDSVRLLNTQSEIMSKRFRNVIADLLVLSDLDSVKSFYSGEFSGSEKAEADMINFSEKMQIFDQIRYIDRKGNEIIRINLVSGNPELVDKSLLQNKAGRYYFSETAKLSKGEVYVSPFDLNVEKGEIEQPLKPMIRFSTPVFSSGKFAGIVIVNYLGENIIKDFKELTDSTPGKLLLINESGYWMYKDDPDQEWGFMYPERKAYKIESICPDGWAAVVENDFFQKYKRGQLFTIKKIKPYLNLHVTDDDKSWYLLHVIDDKHFGLGEKDFHNNYLFWFVLIFLTDVLLSFLISKIVYQRNVFKLEIEHAALYDALTDLANRNLVFEKIKSQIEQARRYKFSFALFFIDLDGFKNINDTLGHEAGDLLLKNVAERLCSSVRTSDVVGRFGGDEFIVLLSKIKNIKDCEVVSRKILASLKEDFILENSKANVGASIGIAVAEPNRNESPESLVLKADSAMYKVKKSGKNGFAFYNDEDGIPG